MRSDLAERPAALADEGRVAFEHDPDRVVGMGMDAVLAAAIGEGADIERQRRLRASRRTQMIVSVSSGSGMVTAWSGASSAAALGC